MLRPYQKLIIRLIQYIPVLAMIVLSGMYVARQVNLLIDNANTVLVAELRQRLGKDVRVRSTRVRPFGVAILEGVEVAAGDKLSEGRMLWIPRLSVRYNLRALIMGGKGAQSVSRIVVDDPTINLVRRSDGSLNIQDLIPKPTGPAGPPFTGSVEIRNGQVRFTDYLAGGPQRPAITRFGRIDGLLDADKTPVFQFGLSARGASGTFADVRAVGQYDSKARQVDVDITGNDVSAKYWADYFRLSKSIDVRGGKLDVALGLRYRNRGGKSRTTLAGAFKVRDGSVQLPMFTKPMQGVVGSVALSGERISLSLKGVVGESPVTATGSIDGFANPRFNLLATSPSANYPKLMMSLKVPEAVRELRPYGTGPLRVAITGRASEPVIDAVATIPQVRVRGYNPQHVRVAALYKNDRLELHSLAFDLLGGRVSGRGTVSTKGEPRMAIEGRADGVLLAGLPMPEQVEATGRGSASFVLSGTIADPRLSASVLVSSVKVAGVPIDSAGARVDYANGEFSVSGLKAVGGPAGSVLVEGRMSMKSLDITVTSDGTDLARLGHLLGMQGIAGTGYVKAHVTGSPERPRFEADAELFEVSYQGYDVDYACLNLAGDTRGVRIREATIRLYPAELHLSGQIGRLDADRIPFQVDGNVDRLTVSKLTRLIGKDIDLTGTLSGSLEAAGIFSKKAGPGESPFVGVTADASLNLEHGTVMDMPISEANAKLAYTNDVLEVETAQMSSQGATATVTGTVGVATGALDLQVGLTDLDLARLKDKIEDYARVGGVLKASASVRGTFDSPVADVMASIDGLSVSSRRFDLAQLHASYADDLVKSFGVDLKRGDQSFSIDGLDFDPLENTLASASGSIRNVSVPDLWGIISDSAFLRSEEGEGLQNALSSVPRIKSGVVDGSFEMSGSLARPTGMVKLNAKDIGLDIRNIESVDIAAVARDGQVTLQTMQARSQNAVLTVSGGLSIPERTMQLDVDASYVDLASLSPWLGDSAPGGVMQANASVSGPMSAPNVMGTVEVVNPSFGGVKFDRLRTEPIVVEDGRITFSSIRLESKGHKAVASGSLPWRWSEMSIPNSEAIDLNVALKGQNLTLLGLFAGDLIDSTKTAGAVDANFTAKGTISEPQLEGYVNVKNGTLALSKFTNEFNNVNLDLKLKGDRISVDEMSAASSLGGVIRALPGGYVTVSDLENSKLDLKLVADGFVVAERNALGFKEEVNSRIDAGISVSGTLASPLIADAGIDTNGDGTEDIAGGISISKSRIAFEAPEGAKMQFAQKLAVDPRFNVSLRVGTNVWVLPPSMAMHVLGSGSVKGRLSKPELALKLQVVEGNMKLASSRLAVEPGGVIEALYVPPAEPELRVDFRAHTSVTSTNQFGKRQRYRIDMVVKGGVGDLQVNLVSSPGGLSREQMLAALGRVDGILGGGEAQLQKELGNVLTAVGTSALLAPLESVFVNKLGFDQFTLEYATDRPLALYVSRRLFENLYLSYYGRLTSGFTDMNEVSYEVDLGYRFADKYTFGLGVNNQAIVSLQAQYTFPF